MYSFTKYLPDNRHKTLILCDCSRQYIAEEMYCCLPCSQIYCRFCTLNEIYCYYCRFCGESGTPQDMNLVKTQCTSCFECPTCKNPIHQVQDQSGQLYYYCQYCFWSSKQMGIADSKIDNLYAKIGNEVKKQSEPMTTEFLRQVTRLRELEQDQKNKKQISKAKKMFNRSYNQQPTKNVTRQRFTQNDQLNQEAEQTEKIYSMKYKLDTKGLNQFGLNGDIPQNMFKTISSEVDFDKDLETFKKTSFLDLLSIDQRIRQILPNTSKKQLMPIPLLMLTKKNRKCRECNAYLVKIDRVKENKFSQNVTSYLCDFTPHMTIVVPKSSNQNEIQAKICFQNRTKQNLSVILKPLSVKVMADNHYVSDLKSYPTQQIELPAIDIDTSQEKLQQIMQKNTFDFGVQAPQKQGSTLQFGFQIQVEVTNDVDKEKKKLQYSQFISLAKQ